MRKLFVAALFGACFGACSGSNNVAPRVIAGGGVGDGDIDGEVNIYIIDNDSEAPIANAMVDVGASAGTTDATGLVTINGVHGAQTIAVAATGYEGTVWADVDGANVTIPVTATAATPDQATLSGSIDGWSSITVAAQHIKYAVVTYSQNDKFADAANNLTTPNNGNVCGLTGTTCNWSIDTRTGSVTLVATIVDRDTKGTLTETDDTMTIIGYAYDSGIMVTNGVTQSGLTLTQVEAGSEQNVTVDLGTPPAALTTTQSVVGIELSTDEVIELATFAATDPTNVLVPMFSVFSPTASYRLTAIAQTASGAQGAESIVLRDALVTTALSAGTWLVPPTGVSATLSSATFIPVTGAAAHQISWLDATGNTVLQVTEFDPTKTTVNVPALVALPSGRATTANISGLGANFDVTDFSLDADRAQLWGVTTQPTTLP